MGWQTCNAMVGKMIPLLEMQLPYDGLLNVIPLKDMAVLLYTVFKIIMQFILTDSVVFKKTGGSRTLFCFVCFYIKFSFC